MFGTYFYNESMRRMTIGFGQIFNNIQIKRKNSSGDVVQSIRVPLAYAPKEKFLLDLTLIGTMIISGIMFLGFIVTSVMGS